MTEPARLLDAKHSIRRTMQACTLLVVSMLGLAYAAVPLYSLFCKMTGFGGTPIIATKAPDTVGTRVFSVQFDSNVANGLPWRFSPEQPRMDVRAGETMTVIYKITNLSDRETAGMATYNVQPEIIASYFNKLECFCFNEMVLKPRETVEVPVVFFIDPAAAQDRDIERIAMTSLSYTFFPAKRSEKSVVQAKDAVAGSDSKL